MQFAYVCLFPGAYHHHWSAHAPEVEHDVPRFGTTTLKFAIIGVEQRKNGKKKVLADFDWLANRQEQVNCWRTPANWWEGLRWAFEPWDLSVRGVAGQRHDFWNDAVLMQKWLTTETFYPAKFSTENMKGIIKWAYRVTCMVCFNVDDKIDYCPCFIDSRVGNIISNLKFLCEHRVKWSGIYTSITL